MLGLGLGFSLGLGHAWLVRRLRRLRLVVVEWGSVFVGVGFFGEDGRDVAVQEEGEAAADGLEEGLVGFRAGEQGRDCQR